MSEHNIKITLFGNDIDPIQWTQNSIAQFVDYSLFGSTFERFNCDALPSDTNTKTVTSIEIENRQKFIEAGSDILLEYALRHSISNLLVGFRTGVMTEGQLWLYCCYSLPEQAKNSVSIGPLFTQLKKNLPFSIKNTCSNLTKPKYVGDIVAMNRSTLREIIAHD